MSDLKVEEAAKLMAGPRALTIEQKRRKFPHEFALKDEYARYLELEDGTPECTASVRLLYEQLKRLAEIVAVFKYGRGRRLNLEFLPHEVAASVVMTIVTRRKHVYSWTNLMKKVVRDYVSNHLRHEYYDTVVTVGVNEMGGEADVSAMGKENHFYERVQSAEGFSTDDLIYLDQILRKTAYALYAYCGQQASLQSYLLATWALNAVTKEEEHVFVAFLPARHRVVYDFHVERIRTLLSPILNHTAFSNSL